MDKNNFFDQNITYFAVISNNFVNLQGGSIVCAMIYLALAGVFENIIL